MYTKYCIASQCSVSAGSYVLCEKVGSWVSLCVKEALSTYCPGQTILQSPALPFSFSQKIFVQVLRFESIFTPLLPFCSNQPSMNLPVVVSTFSHVCRCEGIWTYSGGCRLVRFPDLKKVDWGRYLLVHPPSLPLFPSYPHSMLYGFSLGCLTIVLRYLFV